MKKLPLGVKKKTVGVSFSPELRAALDAAAKTARRSRSDFIERVIEKHLSSKGKKKTKVAPSNSNSAPPVLIVMQSENTAPRKKNGTKSLG